MVRVTCPVCGTKTTRPHGHHPGLEENFPGYEIEVCGGCHLGAEGLTARQFDTGMLRDHQTKNRSRDPRPEPERSFDLLQGTVDLVAASIRAAALQSEDEGLLARAQALRATGPAAARMFFLAEAGKGPGTPKPLGPEPAKNRRRWKRKPAHRGGFERRVLRASERARCSLPGRAGGLLLCLYRHSRVSGEVFRTGSGEVAARIAESQDRVTKALEALVRHPKRTLGALLAIERSPDVGRLMAAMAPIGAAMEDAVLKIGAADDPQAMESVMLEFLPIGASAERAFCAFAHEISDGDDPEHAALRLAEALEALA